MSVPPGRGSQGPKSKVQLRYQSARAGSSLALFGEGG